MADWAFVGMGSNLGDREAILRVARDGLHGIRGVARVITSSLYETEPVGPPQGHYLNAVAGLETSLGPAELLAELQALELAAGRQRSAERNAPRTLDLDLLLYGDLQISEPGLEVPHPRLSARAFVLEPLAQLCPDRIHPKLGVTMAELAERVRDPSAVRKLSGSDWERER